MLNTKASELGQRVRTLRERNGWSQKELASRIPGVRQQSIHQLEQGGIRWPRYLSELAEALGVREEWLRTGQGRMVPSKPEADRDDDPGLVRDVVLGVDQALKRHGIELNAQDRADLIGRMFELSAASENGGAPERLAEAADVIVRYERLRLRDKK